HLKNLILTLQNLSNDDLLPFDREFNQFLNLTNVAEQYNSISPHGEAASNPVELAKLIERLKDKNFTNQQIKQAVEQ
ncbi:phosphoenolpyruvate carboxylase, partial [Proteus mirabilis]|uniref:phosphoenolpyruvate carboxylase n=1 Tax=Proteus mirabilis TaxID=584 RepID=UPI002575BEA5